MNNNNKKIIFSQNKNKNKIFAIKQNHDKNILTLTNESGTKQHIYEQVLSKSVEEIKKNTCDIVIWKENTLIKSFLDEGASITACGKIIFKNLIKYIDNTTKSSIAGGMLKKPVI